MAGVASERGSGDGRGVAACPGARPRTWLLTACAAVALLLAAALPDTAAAQQSCSDPIAVQSNPGEDVCAQFIAIGSDGDASAGLLAISGTGDASSPGLLGAGLAISGTGNASSVHALSLTGDASNDPPGEDPPFTCGFLSCWSVSATGDASNTGGDSQCNTSFMSCLAVSGTGRASNTFGDSSCASLNTACIAVSGSGDASNTAGDNSCASSISSGCIAIALGDVDGDGGGDASNTAGDNSCAGTVAQGCRASSVTGDASNTAGDNSCGGTAAQGCSANSVTGNASNEAGHNSCAGAQSVFASGCIAGSVSGDASNTAGESSCGGGVLTAGCTALSFAGDASNSAGSDSCGAGVGSTGCTAATSEGNASNSAGDSSCASGILTAGCQALSSTGSASNSAGESSCAAPGAPLEVEGTEVPVSGLLNTGCVAASATGDASNEAGDSSCGSGTAVPGCLAASTLGDVSNSAGNDSCGSGEAALVGCAAMTFDGDASNAAGNDSCGAGAAAVGCVAGTFSGEASNTAGEDSCAAREDTPTTAGCVAMSNAEGEDAAANEHGDGSCGTFDGAVNEEPRLPRGCIGLSPDDGIEHEAHGEGPGISPPGTNDFACEPSADKPHPVILVHGTVEDMTILWSLTPVLLAQEGYCVFALDYGARGTRAIEDSAEELAAFVDRVLAATGADKVSIIGHSQGGMMPRHYIRFLGGGSKVEDLIGLAPSNYGTTTPAAFGCRACTQQRQGSDFLNALNAGDDTPGEVSYTVVQTRNDEIVTPYTNAFLRDGAPGQLTNVLLQDKCAEDFSDHLMISNNPRAVGWALNALERDGPADPAFNPEPACPSDSDGDAVYFFEDNCPTAANPDQRDADGDGAGDACDSAGGAGGDAPGAGDGGEDTGPGDGDGSDTGPGADGTPATSPESGPAQAPMLRLLGPVMAPRVWALGAGLPRLAQRAPVGTTIAWGQTARALVGVQFRRILAGRRFRGRCLPDLPALRRLPRCLRIADALLIAGVHERGIHRLGFQGRLSATRFLPPGLYAVRILARDAAGIASSGHVLFRVLAPAAARR